MIALAHSATTLGVEGHLVRLEADSRPGTPSFSIIGLPDRALGESRERVRSAIVNSGLLFPAGRLLVNLAPADLPKGGPGFDVPLALALLAIDEQVERERVAHAVIIGELALDGGVRAISGVLPMILSAKAGGFPQVIVPVGNAPEASLVEGIKIFAVGHLLDVVAIMVGKGQRFLYRRSPPQRAQVFEGEDFADVRGQAVAKRALEIAAAGGHNIRLIGPPGCGKTMLARRLPSILPRMTDAEALEVTAIRSAAGLLDLKAGLSFERPFRAPHHTVTPSALIGGGRIPQPGEASLAHHGVLFLDEFPEFARATLEVLRQPLEEGKVMIARSAGSVTYPTRFSLVAAMNPCPCGMRMDRQANCRCDDAAVARYLGRISGPLLDRIDLTVQVRRIALHEEIVRRDHESSLAMRQRVEQVRLRQVQRKADTPKLSPSRESPLRVQDKTAIEKDALCYARQWSEKHQLSARSYYRTLNVARTIADLDGRERINTDDVAEATIFARDQVLNF